MVDKRVLCLVAVFGRPGWQFKAGKPLGGCSRGVVQAVAAMFGSRVLFSAGCALSRVAVSSAPHVATVLVWSRRCGQPSSGAVLDRGRSRGQAFLRAVLRALGKPRGCALLGVSRCQLHPLTQGDSQWSRVRVLGGRGLFGVLVARLGRVWCQWCANALC